MSESRRGRFGWLRRWLGRERRPPPKLPGDEVITTGARALRALEVRLGADVVEAELGGAASTAAQLATAAGRALTGRRVAVFTPADALAAELGPLRAIAERRLPLVLHVNVGGPAPPGSGHGGRLADVHAAAELGWLVAVARDAQEAVDLTLVARRVAEESLTPVLLAAEGPEVMAGPGRLLLPEDELVTQWVGRAGDTVDCPTEAQQILFGATRRRTPQWLDPAAPVAVAAVRSGLDRALSDLGRPLFFGRELAATVEAATVGLTEQTGRALSRVVTHRVQDARVVIVAHGGLVETARAVVDQLRAAGQRVGLVGVSWLQPLDRSALRGALRGVPRVAVVESAGDGSPLLRLVQAALAGGDTTVVGVAASATGLPVRAAELAALAEKLLAGAELPERYLLGVDARAVASDYPRREVLLQAARRALPSIETAGLGGAKRVDWLPSDARTVTWWGSPGRSATRELTGLAEQLSEGGRPWVRSRWREVADNVWVARLTAAESVFSDPGDETRVDAVVLAEVPKVGWVAPLDEVVNGGALVLAGRPRLAPAWIEAIRTKKLRVASASGDESSLGDAVAWLLAGAEGDGPVGVERIDADALEARAELRADDSDVPAVVRRHRSLKERYDNLPRFWGEVVQPRVLGEAPQPLPDPLVTLGAVPANTAALFDRTPDREALPRFLGERCSGCSRCWVSCPDAALAPVAVGTQAWLEAGLELASAGSEERDPAADKLRRALPQLAKRLDGRLVQSAATLLESAPVGEAFDWLAGKMGASDDDRAGMAHALDVALEKLSPLDAVITEPLFRRSHGEQGGSGALLMLAVDPHACQGCGICAVECPEEALEMVAQTPDDVAAAREGWHLWEALPDTPGSVVQRARSRDEVGALGGLLLSRYAGSTVLGADGAEPGSGERLAARQVTAVVELEQQRALVATADRLAGLGKTLREAIRAQMGDAMGAADLSHLDEALQRTLGARVRLADVIGGLEAQGDRAIVDQPLLSHRVEAARAVDEQRWALVEGPEGLGWARYAVVLDRATAESWAARFPRNPFGAPVAVALDSDAASLALGVAEGLTSRWVEVARAARLAALAAEAPSAAKIQAEADALAGLAWGDLSEEEQAGCPPVIVIAAAESLVNDDLGALSRLLRAPLPLLLVLTDGRGVPDAVDPALLALSHRESSVLSTSVAHPDHLFAGVSTALRAGRPALVHVYAPSPARHGFSAADTVARARLGVTARVHPLLRYDPGAEGVFGTRLALEGNPAPDRDWATDEAGAEVTPATWATGEARFESGADDLVAVSAHRWRLLQELAGVVTPFTERVRAEVTEQLEASQHREVEALIAEYERRMAEREAALTASQASHLRDRLLALAGYDPSRLQREADGGQES